VRARALGHSLAEPPDGRQRRHRRGEEALGLEVDVDAREIDLGTALPLFIPGIQLVYRWVAVKNTRSA
jgi:hypothetical protein